MYYCASFLSGIAFGSILPVRDVFSWRVLPLVLLAGSLAAIFRKKKWLRPSVLILFCFVLGLGRFLQAEKRYADEQALFPSGIHGRFLLQVESEPELVFERTPDGHETGRLGETYLPQVAKVRFDATLLSVNDHAASPIPVRVNFRRKPEDSEKVLSYGDRVSADGVLSVPLPAMNPGGFDYASYLKAKGIPFTLTARAGDWALAQKGRGRDLVSVSLAVRRVIEEKATELWPYPTNALWVGLLLGGDQTLQDDVVQDFAVTGTVHILAVSGANTALVTGLLFLMLRVVGFRRKKAAAFALAGLGLFVFMTGAPPSVCRAGLWGALILIALILERKPRLGTLAVLSAALLAAANPFTLNDLSFQLSYLAVLSLVVFTPWWMRLFRWLWQPAALTLSATLGAQMGVWVLMAAKFNQFATYSIPANLAVAPLVGLATASGLLAITSSFICNSAGALFAAAAEVPLNLLLWTASWMAGWPGASLVVATPPTVWLALFHLLLGMTLWVFWPTEAPEKPSADWERSEQKKKRARGALKITWALFALVSISAWVVSAHQAKPFRMTFLSVGHGNAVVVEDPHGHVMVVDGGPRRDGPARWNPVVAYLRHQGVRKVDWVVSSHPDSDHVGGLAAVVDSFPTAEAAQPIGAHSQSLAYTAFVKALEKRGTGLKGLSQGDLIFLGPGEELEVVHPPRLFQPRKKKENNRSLALWVAASPGKNEKTFLLPGDMEREAWDVYLRGTKRPPKVDVLMTSHHGRASGQPERVMEALKPFEVVVSDSGPHPEIKPLPRGERAMEVRETAKEGAIWVEVDSAGGMKVDSFRPSKNKEQGERNAWGWEEENSEKE